MTGGELGTLEGFRLFLPSYKMGLRERPRSLSLYVIHCLVVSLYHAKDWWVSLCAIGQFCVPL